MNFDINPETDLELTRDIAASTLTVWRCLTEADLLEQWFCPRPYKVVDAVVDPVPGGAFHTPMVGPDGETMDEGPGCVLTAEPHKHFVFTDHFHPGYKPRGSGFMVGAYILDAIDTGTRLRAIAMHTDPAQKAEHEKMGFHEGWGTALEQLDDLAKRL